MVAPTTERLIAAIPIPRAIGKEADQSFDMSFSFLFIPYASIGEKFRAIF